jgi:EAL domain-containing protein (putative c-di-GMP-specific phosphodiesterase class I)
MTLLFQPIVNLRGDRTERYELLLRMHDGEGRELLPETVFTVAQKHQLGMILDRWVITQAIRLVRERQACEYATRLFINVSPAILQDSEIVYWLKKVLDSAGVHAKGLVFEVAEATAMQQLEQWRQFARGIRALGCGLSLDRFRAHDYASDLFEKLPATYVKLDARYVHELVGNAAKQKALRKLVENFSRRDIKTIVGSVEDLPTLEAIWSCGIAYAQGYFLQRPHEKMDYEFVRSAATEALP